MSTEAAHGHHEHRLRPEDWPDDPHFGKASQGKLGMWIFLLSDAFMFAGFLLAYGIARGGHGQIVDGVKIEYWRCSEAVIAQGVNCVQEPTFGIPFTALLTFILILSSVSMVMAYAAVLDKDRQKTVKWLTLTILGGVLFLIGQAEEYWGVLGIFSHGLINEGLIFGQSAYASTFYNITSFHGAHVFTGVCILIWCLFRARGGHYDDGDYNEIEIVGLFWHFVDLIWILVFTVIYLIPEISTLPQ